MKMAARRRTPTMQVMPAMTERMSTQLQPQLDHPKVCPHLVLCKTGVLANITNFKFLDEKSAGPLPVFVLGDHLQSAPLLHWVQIFCLPSRGPQPDQPSPVRDRPGGTLKYDILTKAGPLLRLHLDYRLPERVRLAGREETI